MKIAFSTLGCPDWNWDLILATAKDLHFDGIEIRGIANELYAPKIPVFLHDKIGDTIGKLNRMHLEISCLTSACYLYDKDAGERTIKEGKEYIDLASALNVPYVRVLGDKDPQPGPDIDDGFVSSQLKQLCDYASQKGVTVLIETNGVFADSDRLYKLVEKTDSDALAVLWDVHHPFRFFNESPDYTYSVLKEKIRYLHVKDSVMIPESGLKYRMMGYGDVPLKSVFDILKKNGYDGYVTLEWVKRWYSELEEPGVVFMQYRSFMNKMQRG